jgi:hypothetical protein
MWMCEHQASSRWLNVHKSKKGDRGGEVTGYFRHTLCAYAPYHDNTKYVLYHGDPFFYSLSLFNIFILNILNIKRVPKERKHTTDIQVTYKKVVYLVYREMLKHPITPSPSSPFSGLWMLSELEDEWCSPSHIQKGFMVTGSFPTSTPHHLQASPGCRSQWQRRERCPASMDMTRPRFRETQR